MQRQSNDLQDDRTTLIDTRLRMLTPEQIRQIDKALTDLGPFSEVRLIKAKGRLRFIQKVDSEILIEP